MTSYAGEATCLKAPKKCHHLLNKTGRLVAQRGFSMSFIYPDDDWPDSKEHIQSTPVVFCWQHKDNLIVRTRSGSRYVFSIA